MKAAFSVMSWKSLLALCATAFCFFLGYRYYNQQFHLENVQATWPAEEVRTFSMEDRKALEALATAPFTYLDRGKQSYVFLSGDGTVALKFFDTRCLRSGSYPLLSPLSEKKCAKKMQRQLRGYQTAIAHDKEHTGLIYVQLSPNSSYSLPVTVVDRFGFKHEVDLAKVPFALQKRAVPTRELVSELLAKDDVEGTLKRLQQIVDMYIDEYKHGVIDTDHNVMYNTGFADGQPMRLDVGRLQYDEKVKDPKVYCKDLHKVAVGRIGEWLQRHFPQYRKDIVLNLDCGQGNSEL